MGGEELTLWVISPVGETGSNGSPVEGTLSFLRFTVLK